MRSVRAGIAAVRGAFVVALGAASLAVGCLDFAGLGSAPERFGTRPSVDVEGDAATPDGGCRSPTDLDLRVSHCGEVECGVLTVRDSCGAERSVDCGSPCEAGKNCKANVCMCEPESDAAFCARRGAACGENRGTDNCSQPRTVASCGACSGSSVCYANSCGRDSDFAATTASMAGDGLDNCGPIANDVCARSLMVTGGTFYRGTGIYYPATVSDFRLDKYEVTVGRFRKFVDAWVGGWRPSAGSGKHTHLNGGAGLANTAGGNEPGWDAAWSSQLGTTKANWDTDLKCTGISTDTWTSAADANERRPQNCLSWYDLHAFCIWDGGFLPSEAEWEYAAAGGSEERTYPWGAAAPGANPALAIYGCYYSPTGSCPRVTNIAPVGTALAGASKTGQLDLAGSMWEWILDWYQDPYAVECNNCTNLTAAPSRGYRGGSFHERASDLPAARRNAYVATNRNFDRGGRCARAP
jgi:sulfatase modifying factor 1